MVTKIENDQFDGLRKLKRKVNILVNNWATHYDLPDEKYKQ